MLNPSWDQLARHRSRAEGIQTNKTGAAQFMRASSTRFLNSGLAAETSCRN
jgi:hypothetical protein